jgi:DNA-binding IscR family transcriptional regulator
LPVADEETFVLARDPERISIKEILDSVRNSGVKKQTFRSDEEVFIDELLRKVDDSVAQTLEGKSLQSLIVEHSPLSP